MKVKLTGCPAQSTIHLSDMTPNSFGIVTNSEDEGSNWDDWIGHIVYMGLDSHPHCMAIGRWASVTRGCPLWVRTLQPGEKVEIVI
jgi:hypothetical protein